MPDTNQTIQKFYRNASTRDFSRDFLFRVLDLRLAGIPVFTENELVYAKAAKLPGRVITNVAVPYMGLNFNAAGTATYPGSDAYNLNFYLDKDCTLRGFFEEASRNLFDDISSTGAYGTPNDDTYILLGQLDKELNVISEYKLIGAQLKSITDIDYKMAEGNGATVEVAVTISYHYYIKPLSVLP
jgi:hypothetical protein